MTLPDEAVAVSVVVPVRNGARWLAATIAAIRREVAGRPFEILVVDDGSTDASRMLLDQMARDDVLRVLEGRGRGAAAAINLGIATAVHPIVCQIDQDVIIEPGWMDCLVDALVDPGVAAAQGRYVHHRGASIWSRVMALDLELRYAALRGQTTHVCTGNTAYRRSALEQVGPFDEDFGYGYDNDMSYRLRAAGHRLVFRAEACSRHEWREGLAAYCRQQYGFGYGRLDVVARHPTHITGDSVSPLGMMLHPAATAAAWVCLALGVLITAAGGYGWWLAALGVLLVATLVFERAIAGVRAWRRFGDAAALLFPLLHLLRDQVWVSAIVAWLSNRLLDRSGPWHSMRPRPAGRLQPGVPRSLEVDRVPAPSRILAVVPAHNEAASLPSVLAELRACHPDMSVLVIDDGSTDGTVAVLEACGARWLRLPERLGVGSAMRAGLTYAARLDFDGVIRVDGDGQHRPDEISALLEPLLTQRADVVLGSRYVGSPEARRGSASGRLAVRLLGAWLSLLTGRAVTDPTSGFCAFGPRAVRVLSEYHPTGYPEPELHLIAVRHALAVEEVPVRPRARVGGRTSLTPARIAAAAARVLLVLVLEPLRSR